MFSQLLGVLAAASPMDTMSMHLQNHGGWAMFPGKLHGLRTVFRGHDAQQAMNSAVMFRDVKLVTERTRVMDVDETLCHTM